MSSTSHNPSTTVEAKVTSKGQVTLPKELRKRLGIQNGSRIRFSIPASGPVQVYGSSAPITDCRSGVCHPAYLWFNGYISPTVIGTLTVVPAMPLTLPKATGIGVGVGDGVAKAVHVTLISSMPTHSSLPTAFEVITLRWSCGWP